MTAIKQGLTMFVRVRYFPLFVLLALVLVLLIPYYYMDHSWTANHELKLSEDVAAWRPPPPPAILPPVKEQPAISSMENEIIDNHISDEKENVIMPQVSPPRQSNININPQSPYGFMHLHPHAAEFALQMAQDRLRLEKYGMLSHQQRQNINSNKTYNGDQMDDDDTPESKLRVLIVSYFRGGTTFFGDLLNQHPGTFYHFEPLHMVSKNDQVETQEQVAQANHLLRNLLRCQYDAVPSYTDWIRREDHRFLFEHNRRLWLGCQFQPPLCYEPKFLNAMCKMHPVHVFKLVRLRLSYTKRLLDEFPELLVIYFVRDPRGLYSSRRDLLWCNVTRSCIDPFAYCSDMRQDLSVALKMKSQYKDRFLALRYEDLALDTENNVKKILEFLKIKSNPRMDRFIESHTHPRIGEDLGGPYSTKRDSKRTAFQWRKKLSPQEVSYVESACGDVLQQLALP